MGHASDANQKANENGNGHPRRVNRNIDPISVFRNRCKVFGKNSFKSVFLEDGFRIVNIRTDGNQSFDLVLFAEVVKVR